MTQSPLPSPSGVYYALARAAGGCRGQIQSPRHFMDSLRRVKLPSIPRGDDEFIGIQDLRSLKTDPCVCVLTTSKAARMHSTTILSLPADFLSVPNVPHPPKLFGSIERSAFCDPPGPI